MWTFAEYLRHERLTRNFTMESLARLLHISPQFISLLENGRRHPSPSLMSRCAELFGADLNYVAFLAQRIPVEQKQALAESPAAPDYIPRDLRSGAGAADAEEALLRQLLLPAGAPRPETDGPYTGNGDPRPPFEADAVAGGVTAAILGSPEAFSPKATVWAAFHEAYVTRLRHGRVAALPGWALLSEQLERDTLTAHGSTVRHLVAMQQCMALREAGRPDEAEAFALRAGEHAVDGHDDAGVARAAFAFAVARRDAHDPFGAADALAAPCARPGVPAVDRAHCSALLVDLLASAHEYERARDAAVAAAPLLRTTALAIATPERSGMLFRVQVAAVEALVELGDLVTAAGWLNRARSLGPRVGAGPECRARLAAAAGMMFLARGRPAMACKQVARLREAEACDPHARRRALRVLGNAAVQLGEFASAHATADELLDTPLTGVLVQDVAAAGWAQLVHCEAHCGERDIPRARACLADLASRVQAACAADARMGYSSAVRTLTAEMDRRRLSIEAE